MKHVKLITLLILLPLTLSAASHSSRQWKEERPVPIQSIPTAQLVSQLITLNQDNAQNQVLRENNEKVILVLQTRDYLLTVYSGESDQLYSVSTEGGVALTERLNGSELKARFPELYDVANNSWAGVVTVPGPLFRGK
jgi:hypothetical protein